MDVTDRDRKKTWRLQQQKLAQNAFPISDHLLESMFEAVDAKVSAVGCDHTMRFTESWIAENVQPEAKVLSWLRDHGGFCDCEVLNNAADYWAQNR